MKILIDGTLLSSPYGKGGVGRYVRDLVRGLSELGPELHSAGAEIEIAADAAVTRDWPPCSDRLRVRPLKLGTARGAAMAAQVQVSRLSQRSDVLHSPVLSYDPGLPSATLRPGCPQTVVVHDLIPLSMPSHYLDTVRRRFWYGLAIKRVKAADRLIAVSGHTADALRLLGCSAVSTVPNAIPSLASTAFDREVDRWRRGAPVAFAPHGPSKNPSLLAVIARALAGTSPEHRLHVIGPGPAPAGAVSLGRLSEAALRSVYESASALLVPSLYEGFCYPAVEAANLGLPVLALDATWSRWLFASRDNLLEDRADAWVDSLTRGHIRPPMLRSDLRNRTPKDVARETLRVWLEVGN